MMLMMLMMDPDQLSPVSRSFSWKKENESEKPIVTGGKAGTVELMVQEFDVLLCRYYSVTVTSKELALSFRRRLLLPPAVGRCSCRDWDTVRRTFLL